MVGEASGIKGKRKGKKQDMGSDFCADIGEIEVDVGEEVLTKMRKYLAVVGDPYNFCVGKTRVRVTFGRSHAPSVQSGLEKISMRKP